MAKFEINYHQREFIGQQIRQIRLNSGMSVEELADRCGCKPSTIVNIEKGRFSINLDMADNILRQFGYELAPVPIRDYNFENKD